MLVNESTVSDLIVLGENLTVQRYSDEVSKPIPGCFNRTIAQAFPDHKHIHFLGQHLVHICLLLNNPMNIEIK